MKPFFFLLLSLTSCATGSIAIRSLSAPPQDPPSCILIYPLENLSLTSRAGVVMGDLLANAIAERYPEIGVISPSFLLSFPEGQKILSRDPSRPETLREIHEKLSVDGVIAGSLGEFWYTDDPQVYRDKQPSISLIVRFYSTENPHPVFSIFRSKSPTPWFGETVLLTTLANEVAEELATIIGERLYLAPPAPFKEKPCGKPAEILSRFVSLPQPTPFTSTSLSSLSSPITTPVEIAPETATLFKRLTSGDSVILEGVKFEGTTTRLKDSSIQALTTLANLLKTYPEIKVLITVHTSGEQEPLKLKAITNAQGEEISRFLKEQGVPPERFLVEGKGGEENLVPNLNEFLREKNRRVEVRLLREEKKE
jgi:outer membrane protein OmpA-like peptidoglycan-associated protein